MLNWLELVVETLRAALEALTVAAPQWLSGLAPPEWYDRYGQRASDYRLPTSEAKRDAYARLVGHDGYLLLEASYRADAPGWVRNLPAVQTLRQVWIQQFYRCDQVIRMRGKDERPPGALAIGSPYDTEARYAIKRGVGWRGYKAHFTETCEPDRPHLIVHAVTTVATTADVETTPRLHADLAARGLLPDEHLVDAGYVSVDQIIEARTRYGVDLVGPLPPDSGWQAREADAFDISRFQIDWDNRQVTCPNGKSSRNWRERHSRNGLPIVQATFRLPDCAPCPDRSRCTRSVSAARNLTFRPRAEFEEQRRIRAEQATAVWRDRYAVRSGVEGTIAQGSRRCDLHRSRYLGLAKTHVQHILTAAALNLARLDAWLTETPLGGTRSTRFTQLRLTAQPG